MNNLLAILLILSTISLSAQTIDYSVPEGYEELMSKKDYKFLVNESRSVIARSYEIASISKGVVQLKEGQAFSVANLHNLMLKCAPLSKRDWPAVIEDHFSRMVESIHQQEDLDPTNFAAIKDYLSIRVYPEAYVEQNGGADNMIVEKHLNGTWSVLMLDLPSVFKPMQKEHFDLWNKGTDEVFAIAQQNVNKQAFITASETVGDDKQQIEVHFIENEDYGASLALDLQTNTPEFVGEWGSVVAIPNKGIVDICKVFPDKPVDFVLFIQMMQPIVQQSYYQHPQPVSTDFFWYYHGKFTRILVVEENGSIQVISPQGLTELMSKGK
ncbi:hypothetical protein CLV84_0106 [Neolewinella xylanilytica]|uniref:Uncharacterized protein n=1 Tax=Neolewinella xylanilytica TaxID=1514080 RepID=A0A2S6I6R4_9BACT|nr:hypothetical protein [Neolewinella xylanilytica]PPK87171.1 hypothetical protein CLV84_0106 [Neolewinella xylanilytica]